MNDFKFSLMYLAGTGTASTLVAGSSLAAGYTTLGISVLLLPLILNGGWTQ